MSEFTPTTEQVRRNFAFSMSGDRVHRTAEYFEAFDRWLAERDAEQAEAFETVKMQRSTALAAVADLQSKLDAQQVVLTATIADRSYWARLCAQRGVALRSASMSP